MVEYGTVSSCTQYDCIVCKNEMICSCVSAKVYIMRCEVVQRIRLCNSPVLSTASTANPTNDTQGNCCSPMDNISSCITASTMSGTLPPTRFRYAQANRMRRQTETHDCQPGMRVSSGEKNTPDHNVNAINPTNKHPAIINRVFPLE